MLMVVFPLAFIDYVQFLKCVYLLALLMPKHPLIVFEEDLRPIIG